MAKYLQNFSSRKKYRINKMLRSIFQMYNSFQGYFKKFRITICHILNYMVQTIIIVLEEGDEYIDCYGISFTRCNLPCKSPTM